MEQLLNSYYDNNAKKLHDVIDKIFNRHYGGTVGKDMEEFYGIGTDVLTDIWNKERNGKSTYDSEKGDFDGYVYRAISMAIIDEFKRQNRDKRATKVFLLDGNGEKIFDEKTGKPIKISVPDVRLDAPISNDTHTTNGDLIQSNFDINNEIEKEFKDEKIEKFFNNLSKTQRQIAEMIIEGFSAFNIKQKLKLSDKKYTDNVNAMRSFKNISILCNDVNKSNFMEDEEMITQTQTAENCKTDRISISSINKKIDKHIIRFDHPLQRESDQWSPSMKGNLVSDILQGNKLHPLIFAEQIINGVPIIWDLDGKQRCTNAYSYSHNGYKVSRNIRRWMIKYQTTKKDENGNDVLDENGFPIAVNAEFDIRGKRFSDLPEELRDRFLDYSFNYDQYLNCSEEDIGYHIERYNDGKPMTKPQKGITKIGTEFAEMVKSISNMSFFKNVGGYKVSEFKNGTIDRVVIESVMSVNYFSDWKKEVEKLCEYLKENATSETFDNFEDMVERLEKNITDDVADMFDSKDSFLYFGLYSKFINTGLEDEKFMEFMAEFSRSLHSKEIDGTTYDKLCVNPSTGKTYGTKDKNVVSPKMKMLETLMYDFLHIDKENEEENDDESFISDIVEIDKSEVHENLDIYQDDLNGLKDNYIKDGSKLLDVQNSLSLLAMVAYSYKIGQDLDEWIEDYAKKNKVYIINQKNNFLHMKQDFDNYCKQHKLSA